MKKLLKKERNDSIYFVGDFNADPHSGRAWRNLTRFRDENNLKCFDVDMLPNDTYTFIGYGSSRGRWLDHFVGKCLENIRIKCMSVLYDVYGSDHVPLEINLDIKVDAYLIEGVGLTNDVNGTCVNWSNLKKEDFERINAIDGEYLENHCHYSFLDCDVTGCHNAQHLEEMDLFLSELIYAVKIGSNEFCRSVHRENKYKIILGWNRHVMGLYKTARQRYLDWRNRGKPLDTLSHGHMLETRQEFKQALNYCKANEHMESCISIVEKFFGKDFKGFWREVKKKKGCTRTTNIINGSNTSKDIVKIFFYKFLSSSCTPEDAEQDFIKTMKENWPTKRKLHMRLSLSTLKKMIFLLKSGMGHDGIHSCFLRNASNLFLEKLVLLINGWSGHCYISKDTLRGTISPTVKDSKGNMTEASNYRPVMQSSCILEIVELHLLNILSEKVHFNSRQFGFQSGVIHI